MLQPKYLDQIKKILWQYLDKTKDKAFIFGSWAIGDNRKFSDIDIGIESKRKLQLGVIAELNDIFNESDFPYKVEVVNFAKTTEQFKNVAKQATIPLN